MLGLIVTLLVVALIAGAFGFAGLGGPADLMRLVFYCAVALLLVSAVVSLVRGRTRLPRRHPMN
jgi:uncharacterized membrane protein YtjA (UPF0391 family)